MTKNIKRAVSLLLVSLMIFLAAPPVFKAAAIPSEDMRVTVPTVYVQGYGSYIYADSNDRNSEAIFDGNLISKETLNKLLAGIKDPLLKGVSTNNWTEYCDFVVNTLLDDLEKCKLDNNGEPSNGSGNNCIHDNNVTNRIGSDGKYSIFCYRLIYDWRLDPFVTADMLNEYIQKVKEATGYEKVNLIGRCLGSNIVMAYLSKYGYKDINSLAFYMGLFDGIDVCGALFSGNVTVNPGALSRFVESYLPDDDGNMSLIKALVVVLNSVNGLQLPVDVLLKVYDKVYRSIIPRVCLGSFGVCPSYWSYVNEKYYDDAKKLIFGDRQEKYAELLKKIDNYHYNVILKNEDIIKDALANGVNVYNFVKYGGDMIPLCDKAVYCSDYVTTVTSQSFGTVAAKTKRPFRHKYLKEAEKNGALKYISPDNLIDASGDILRDHTWFLKGIDHWTTPESVEVILANIFNANGYGGSGDYVTTEYFEGYPQFLLASENSYSAVFTPLTEENKDDNDKHKKVAEHFLYLIQRLIDFMKKTLDTLKSKFYVQKDHILKTSTLISETE